MQPVIKKTYLVELNLGTVAANKQVNFNDVPQLRGKRIYGVSTFSRTQLSGSPGGSAMVTTAGLADLVVTFAVGDVQDFYLIPCADLNSPLIFGSIRAIEPKMLILTKSFVTILTTTTVVTNESICFNFIYD